MHPHGGDRGLPCERRRQHEQDLRDQRHDDQGKARFRAPVERGGQVGGPGPCEFHDAGRLGLCGVQLPHRRRWRGPGPADAAHEQNNLCDLSESALPARLSRAADRRLPGVAVSPVHRGKRPGRCAPNDARLAGNDLPVPAPRHPGQPFGPADHGAGDKQRDRHDPTPALLCDPGRFHDGRHGVVVVSGDREHADDHGHRKVAGRGPTPLHSSAQAVHYRHGLLRRP